MIKNLLLSLILALSLTTYSQNIKKALFIGNSYTGVNNLPSLVDSITRSMGDSLIYDSNTPGGYTFQMQLTSTATISKINSNSWDYVILQEQSQLPSFPPSQVQTDVLPYADTLNRIIKSNDSCTTTLFYMTWGREYGDTSNCASYPPVCTYDGMQGRLRYSYVLMGQMFNAEVCPAGMAWKRVRDLDSTIVLYQSDQSHPSIFGSYLVACTFYDCIFQKKSYGSTYIPSGIPQPVALFLQAVADSTVFDSLQVWNIDTGKVKAGFTCTASFPATTFTNTSTNATSYYWDFGDGDTSTAVNPIHNFPITNWYHVMLIAKRNCLADTFYTWINLSLGIKNNKYDPTDLFVYPQPAKDVLNILCNEQVNGLSFEIFDMQGVLVRKGSLVIDQKIDLINIPSGVYCLKVRNGVKYYKPVKFVKL